MERTVIIFLNKFLHHKNIQPTLFFFRKNLTCIEFAASYTFLTFFNMVWQVLMTLVCLLLRHLIRVKINGLSCN